jgi:pectate lyase
VTSGVYTLANGASGKCINVTGASTDNSALLVQTACAATTTSQQWRVQGSGQVNLVNVNSSRCIDVPSSSATTGTQLQQYGCGDGTKPQQLWTFTASTAASGKYLVKSVATGLCLSNAGGSTAGNNPIVEETCSDIARTQWAFNYVTGPTAAPTTSPTGGASRWSDKADGFASTGGGTTGGAGGGTVVVKTYADLLTYVTATEPYVIKVNATITVPTMGYEMPVTSNKTIVGVGKTGRIKAGGFFLGAGVKNVIIRNLTIGDTAMASDDPDDKDFDYDGIQMDTADHVWIDHNTFANINDGYIDSRKDTNYLTVSWNVMGNHNKVFGIGWTENTIPRITIHHNWLFNNTQRNPSAGNVLYAHLYNNYLSDITSYGNAARGTTKMVIENSYFENVKDAFYYETGGLKQTGSILVNCTGQQEAGGTVFTPSSFYAYTLDKAADVPNLVKTYAGPQADIGL